MLEGYIRTAAATPLISAADTDGNAAAIIAQMEEAAGNGAKIIVFPELCVTAYTCADLFHQTVLTDSSTKALCRIVKASDGLDILAFVGATLIVNGKLYNTMAAIKDGRVLCFIPKTFLPNYSEFYEERWFTPAPETVFDIDFNDVLAGKSYRVPFGRDILMDCDCDRRLVIAGELCEDLWVADTPSTGHALAGATVIVNSSASDETVAKEAYRRMLVSATSARLDVAYIYANAGEGESSQDLVFGAQNIIAENGSVVAESTRFTTGIIYADIDLAKLAAERSRLTSFHVNDTEAALKYRHVPFTFKDRYGDCRGNKVPIKRYIDPRPFVPSNRAELVKRCEEILTIQAMGLKRRYAHTGSRKAVIGISGGLDSTLALLVTVRAFDMLGLPRENVVAITMPCFGTTDRTYNNAVTLTRTLGVTLEEINIKEAVSLHFKDIGHDPSDHSVTYENAQARERTQILMDYANKCGALVIGTGDMSELALGWATYNGDHMSMYAVNVGVPKTLVRYLVQYCADCMYKDDTLLAAALKDVLDTPVSPELLPPEENGEIAQRTEDLVGPYELHDFFLYQMLRYGYRPSRVYLMALEAFGNGEAVRNGTGANTGSGDSVSADDRVSAADENGAAAGNGNNAAARPAYDTETIRKWIKVFYRRFFSQHFKRSCLPDGPKVGSIAVSPRGDLRMPSDACARVWMDEIEAL